jgi:hypothetical protein
MLHDQDCRTLQGAVTHVFEQTMQKVFITVMKN